MQDSSRTSPSRKDSRPGTPGASGAFGAQGTAGLPGLPGVSSAPTLPQEPGRAKSRLKQNLLIALSFCLLLMNLLLSLFLPDEILGTVMAPVLILSAIAGVALYLFANRLLLNPLFNLRDSINSFLNTGVRGTATSSGGEIFGELNQTFNSLIDAMRDEEARLSAAHEDSQTRITFLSKMSTRVNAPVQEILDSTETLLGSNLDGRQVKQAEKIRNSATEMTQLLERILDYSNIESGKVTLDNYPFRLDDVLTELATDFRQVCLNKHMDFVFAITPDVPQQLIGDRTRFSQILHNMLNNAFTYSSSGEVFLGCTIEEKNLRNVRLRFTVRDTGVGVPPDDLAKIFTAFFTGDEEADGIKRGLGLGLPIARKLTLLMGGDMSIRSVHSRGTSVSFSISFNLYDPGREQSWESAAPLRGQRILIVEDRSANRLAAYDLLKNWGMHVDAAEDADQALQKIEDSVADANPFRFILLSQGLASNSAFALLRTLSEKKQLEAPGKQNAIILMGNGDAPGASVLSNYNTCAYVAKPLTCTALLHSLLEAMSACQWQEAESEQPAALAEKPDYTGKKILLVEDNPINEQIATEILMELGLDLSVAHTGREALKTLQSAPDLPDRSYPFELILMDIQMPEMDGVAATRLIRQNSRYDAMPIVAMTAHVLRAELENYMAAGMNGHVAKPIDVEKLYAELDRFLSRR